MADTEIILKSRDEAKLEEIWTALRENIERHNSAAPFSPMQHVLRELVFNGIKANLKRIFHEEGLESAGVAVPDFHEALESFSPDLLNKAEQGNRQVRVRFADGGSGFEIRVINDAAMSVEERQMVESLLNSEMPAGAPDGVSQSGEGGGLGLRMVQRILLNCGLGQDALHYESDQNTTTFTLRIPRREPI